MGDPHVTLRENVPLAPLTTLGLGGPARFYAECTTDDEIAGALTYARDRSLPVQLLGGGSNTVVADHGFDGLVLRIATRGISFSEEGRQTLVVASAGEEWDPFVLSCIEWGLGGIECLSGIPGSVGATPVQNVGAYGQEVSERIVRVEAIDRTTLQSVAFTGAECSFGYRTSRFKGVDAGRYVVTGVTFSLAPEARPTVRYRELQSAVEALVPLDALPRGTPGLLLVRDAVLALRRKKGMVLDEADPHSRSVGSFFTNPLLSPEEVAGLQERWRTLGGTGPIPTFGAGTQTKVPAAWLVEHSGFPKGTRRGEVGVSERHSLALVNYGGTTAALLALAEEIEAAVLSRFGVRLEREPVVLR
jgi:UDP-N-acetylmuramate dehydrogenase